MKSHSLQNWFVLLTLACCFVTPTEVQAENLYTIVYRDTVRIWNTGLSENCASRFLFDVTIQDTNIRVTERDTSTRLMTCLCGFDLSVTIGGLASGTYRANIYRSHQAPQYWEFYVGTVQFTILEGGTSAGLREGYQSNCRPVSVEPTPIVPTQFALYPNYPNPFNPTTSIAYDLPKIAFVQLNVFNLLGEKVATLVNGVEMAGTKSVAFDARNLSSGVYFCRLQAGGFVKTMRMMVTK